MIWSKIQDTSLFSAARVQIDFDDNMCHKNLHYHNWDHVVSMYQYLVDTKEPYDEALDWAILFHDIVYDNKPEKEYRSVQLFDGMVLKYDGFSLDDSERQRVRKLIMHTEKHVVSTCKGSSAIVRADLHGLANRLTAFRDFGKIMKESMELYGINEIEFAKSSEDFMRGLMFRVGQNVVSDVEHTDFYVDVAHGIETTIKLSQIIQGKL